MKGLMQHKSDLQKNVHIDATQIVVALIGAVSVIASALIGRM